MRRRNIILVVVLFLLTVVGGVLAVRYLSGVVPYWRCSEVYRRYAHVEGVEAAFVKGFPINDTLGVDVTLLRATDSAGWAYLTEAFNIPVEVLQYAETNPEFRSSENLVCRGSPETRVAVQGKDRTPNLTLDDVELLAIDYQEKEFCIFHTQNAMEVVAVRSYNCEKMINNNDIN